MSVPGSTWSPGSHDSQKPVCCRWCWKGSAPTGQMIYTPYRGCDFTSGDGTNGAAEPDLCSPPGPKASLWVPMRTSQCPDPSFTTAVSLSPTQSIHVLKHHTGSLQGHYHNPLLLDTPASGRFREMRLGFVLCHALTLTCCHSWPLTCSKAPSRNNSPTDTESPP